MLLVAAGEDFQICKSISDVNIKRFKPPEVGLITTSAAYRFLRAGGSLTQYGTAVPRALRRGLG